MRWAMVWVVWWSFVVGLVLTAGLDFPTDWDALMYHLPLVRPLAPSPEPVRAGRLLLVLPGQCRVDHPLDRWPVLGGFSRQSDQFAVPNDPRGGQR